MLRSFIAILLPAALLLVSPTPPVNAQWQPPARGRWMHPHISGRYVIGSNGYCSVSRQGRGYLFVNENGAEAVFDWTGPRRLGVVYTINGWDPNIVATVTRDPSGRMVLRFDAPGTPTGYWTRIS